MKYRRRWLPVAGAAVATIVTLGGVGVALATTSEQPARLTASFETVSNWGTGYEARYRLSNSGGSPVTNWRVEFTLPASARLGASWDATLAGDGGRYVATNRAYNATIAPKASLSFGFIVAGSGAPQSCTVNGVSCDGSPASPNDPKPPVATSSAPASTPPTEPAPPSSQPPAGGAPPPKAQPPAPGPAAAAVSPYIDMGASPTPDLVAIGSSGGFKDLSLAFITAAGCRASWFGAHDPRAGFARDRIDAFRAKGGQVRISFGGANGIELAQACTDVASLEAEYRAVVDAYALTAIDLDIESAAVADATSVARRSAAIARLQRSKPGLKVSYTLPVAPEGLTGDGLAVLRSAVDAGVTIDLVNIMAMDYNRAGDYGDLAVKAAESTMAQLRTLFPAASDAELWQRIGVTPMLGQNDDLHIFDQGDARQLVTFASSRKLGLLSFWEISRDAHACNGERFQCTNIPQQPFEFSRIFAGFAG